MAVAMAAAATLGFLGASQASTAFTVAPGSQAPAKLAGASVATGASAQSGYAASTSSSAALCAGVAVGVVGASVSTRGKARVAAKAGFDPTKSIGVQAPTGYWDPCGLMKQRKGKDGWEWKDEATFEKYRTAELKHGRVAMMAAGGLLANTFWKFPGFEGVPDGLKALSESQGGAGFGIFFIAAAFAELNYPKGNFPDPLKLGTYDDWGYSEDMQNKEIANGRVAMAAVITLLYTEYGTGMGPAAQIANTNFVALVGPALLLGFALGNPDGWSKGEYVPSLLSTGGTLSPVETVTVKASIPAAEPVKELEEKKEAQIEEKKEAVA